MKSFLVVLMLLVACTDKDPSKPDPGAAFSVEVKNVKGTGVAGGGDAPIVEQTKIETALKLIPQRVGPRGN
jgi:hypothetical protein